MSYEGGKILFAILFAIMQNSLYSSSRGTMHCPKKIAGSLKKMINSESSPGSAIGK